MPQYPATFALRDLDGNNGFRLKGESACDQSGRIVTGGGDIIGDGFADVIIGADLSQLNGALFGAAYVVFGHAGPFAANIGLASLDGNSGFRLDGGAVGDRAGSALAMDDVNLRRLHRCPDRRHRRYRGRPGFRRSLRCSREGERIFLDRQSDFAGRQQRFPPGHGRFHRHDRLLRPAPTSTATAFRKS